MCVAAPVGNKYAVGNNGGRPAKYETAEELCAACDEYFIYIQGESKTTTKEVKNEDGSIETEEFHEWVRHPEPATVTGLVLFLGFSSKSSLEDQEKRGEEFSAVIKRARLRVEHGYEMKLHGDKNTGAIFALKNMGWRDKVETGITDSEGKDVRPILQFGVSAGCHPMKEEGSHEPDKAD